MLQPRLLRASVKMCATRNCVWRFSGAFVCIAFALCTTLVSCQDVNNESIEASRIKREGVPENRDLTVLLVNDQKKNDYHTRVGRYHSVKPLIGLLTSTARTFIQDGVTTEFATQILGTTLDNGRIYAQLLTKSSLVLYNKPNNVEDVVVKPTRVHSAFDGEWNVKQDLGFIDPQKFVLKNTDYLAPSSKMEIVYASKPPHENIKYWSPPTSPDNQAENQIFEELTARRVQPVKEIPRYVQNEVFNYLDGPALDNDKKYEFVVKPSILENINVLHRPNKKHESITEPAKADSREKVEAINETNIVKVKPNYDLPTFTIKNEFSPIFYYIDNVESRNSQQPQQQTKLPKKLFGQKSEPRPKKTFTYAGFADFTTVVGDTVIIFTPNTEKPQAQNHDEVNVLPSAKRVDKLATKITFLAADIPVATSTFKAHEVNSATKHFIQSSDENRSEKALYNDEESLKKVLYEVDDKIADPISVQYNNGFDFNLDVIQPSESLDTTTENTRYTEHLEVVPIKEYKPQATEPLSTLYPSATIIDESPESAVTENNIKEMFTDSEEESENTAAEVTEGTGLSEEDEEEITTESEQEQDVVTTTESGHSEELSEEIESTTELRHDIHEEVICSNGLETQSTMTTAYKTLTYLTTYFIPLESTETTTSVKSDVIVESDVGYLTNYVCKTDIDIEPTSVLSIDIKSSIHSNLEAPETSPEETLTEPPLQQQLTEEISNTTPKEKEALTTLQNDDNIIPPITEGVKSDEEEGETTTTSTTSTTTTEHTTTTQSHVEVSVNTEQSTTPTENPTSIEDEDIDSHENEIDLIYKTLYTTYTYFTTFFGDQTSSVSSHTSVVTNVITSTIDIGKLDPSLLGAFDEDEIAPTGVGIGRPTETLALNSIIDLFKNKDVIESVESDKTYSSQTPTPALDEDTAASIKPDAVKTYFTTYTFFTTIYVGTDANVCSRSEVYTNYVGPEELIPTKSNQLTSESTRAQFDFKNCKQIKRAQPAISEDSSSMESSISMEENGRQSDELTKNDQTTPQPTPVEVDMLFSVESNPLEDESTYVTDVKSSSSKGERKFIDNNNILDDQISSESNIDEIMPSPTLLLQTSYTTFTYFTTMYIGKDSSKVKSRLETITNVVTETITPKKEPEEESNLPITYYTTFTYWTTLYKDKSTTITSREEIVSNVVTPVVQAIATVSPIDTTPIDIDSELPPKDLEVEIKPSLVNENLEQDDGKATFYTTYTYFTTFYAGNTSQIKSSLETVTNIVDNTKVTEDNQIARKVPSGAADKNLIQDTGKQIVPAIVKEEILPTKLPDVSAVPSVLIGTYIDNLFAQVKPEDSSTPSSNSEQKVLFSQVAVISGDSTVVTNDNKTLNTESSTASTTTTSTKTEGIISPTPEVIESSVAEPEVTTELKLESEEEENITTRKKSRLSYTSKKNSNTPLIIPFASRNRPTFSPKRVLLPSSATTVTRADFTPTITATPTLKSIRPSGFGGNRKQSAFPGSSSSGRRFSGRSSTNLSGNVPSASRVGSFARGSIQPTSRRTGFRSSSIRSNSLDFASRSAIPRIRPTATSRLRGGRQSASITYPPPENNEPETLATHQEDDSTETLEEVTEAPVRTTNNPLLRFRRPPIARQPGTAITPRSTTPTPRRPVTTRGRTTTTTKRTTARTIVNPLLALRRQRPNSLFPRRNLFKQPEPEPEEEIQENEQDVEDSQEILEGEEFEEDNDYDSSDRKERHVSTPQPKKQNFVQIRPFRTRRVRRQADYGNRKYTNFRRPGLKPVTSRRTDPEPETEAPTQAPPKRTGNRFSSRSSLNTRNNERTTSAPKVQSKKPFIVRGESRTTTTSAPSYRRNKSRAPSRTTTLSSRPKPPRLTNKSSQSDRSRTSTARSSTGRSRTRTTTSRASGRRAFNTNAIVYDNTPWRPGREADGDRALSEDDDRKLKNLATRILSNGVEVLVKDKSVNNKLEQRKFKLLSSSHHASTPSPKSLLSSAVATVINRQQMSAMFPLHQLMRHNYIIKTCMTTYTYLTTVVQNKRSAVSTFETIVSVVTTESLSNIFPSEVITDLKPTKTKYMEVKTIQPSVQSNLYQSSLSKVDKRIDEDHHNFDLIQPSESEQSPCSSSCSCSHTKTEALKTKYTHGNPSISTPSKYAIKTPTYGATKMDLRPTNKVTYDKNTQYPYEYEINSQVAPTDKIVEKYTEVISDYSDEKDTNSVEESELLTNEQAPSPPKTNKIAATNPDKVKPEKPQKPTKNKVVADLLKLGSLSIKGLSQLAPVIEKMTGGFIKRPDLNKTISSTLRPVTKLTPYIVNKRVDSEMESKQSNFPIYIPVDDMETSESQTIFTNATLHQNLAWATEHKQPKAHMVPPKFIHESPLVNGGIPISPGEIITANSDVIVGKPAVGGPLTLSASGIKLHNPVNPPPIDSFVSGNEHYLVHEKPSNEQSIPATKIDDSFDLRPPNVPKLKANAISRPSVPSFNFNREHHVSPLVNTNPSRPLQTMEIPDEQLMKTEHMKSNAILANHGRPAFLDYIPSLAKPNSTPFKHHIDFRPFKEENKEYEMSDNSPSSSEIVSTHVRADGSPESISKPFLVDIQPSRVANVIIPHGSATALVFAGSSEPHKTGDYVDDPLPYPEPGYFGSFSIEAPQMTNVHNFAPSKNKQFGKPGLYRPSPEGSKPMSPPHKDQTNLKDLKSKWTDNKRPVQLSKVPPPTSNQETHLQVGPHITAYNPEIYNPSNGNFDKYNLLRGEDKHKGGKNVIDKEYENYLAVPPPPPLKMHFNTEYEKNKNKYQRPIVHTKPIQDMKVFLNIQHPVPKPNKEQLPPKVTSEIYFATQDPNSKATPTYTIHMPPTPQVYENSFKEQVNNYNYRFTNTNNNYSKNNSPFSTVASPSILNKMPNKVNDKDNSYTVTLNTATNVASNNDIGQMVGSSLPISIGSSSNIGQMNTDIPIGTNFAIRVEDGTSLLENYNSQAKRDPQGVYDEDGLVSEANLGDNRWNTSSANKISIKPQNTTSNKYFNHNQYYSSIAHKDVSPSMPPSLNSHANFPMMNDYSTPANVFDDVKPVTEYIDEVKSDQKRPAKLIPNVPTNSHGWYSSGPINEDIFKNINNIKVEATTRKVIPLLHDFNRDTLPDFGEKISSAGKPPTEFWTQNPFTSLSNHGKPFSKPQDIGKPFTKPPKIEETFSSVSPITTKPFNSNYIPSNLGVIKQPVYDIPVRDNSDETTTTKVTSSSTENIKPVYENSEEVYDGEEESSSYSENESESEVSLESMRVPVVTSSYEKENDKQSIKKENFPKNDMFTATPEHKDKNIQLIHFNPGTQTEKPFGTNNKTKTFQSNTIKPIYENNIYMKPRPFTINTLTTLDHQLQQPHWQINQLMVNGTNASYEENLELNIGEEMSTTSTTKAKPSSTQRTPYRSTPSYKYEKPQRPVFSVYNSTKQLNTSNIITSTIHINDRKPLIIQEVTEKSTSLPTFTITTNLDLNRSSSEIIDLSPPPPTMDYNFKPSTNDEMIMGMSPPPPRIPSGNRQPTWTAPTQRPVLPLRTPVPPYRTKPSRTLPPRVPTQRPTRKPISRDDISTYRPIHDVNKFKRPISNRDQPSSQLLPPPRSTLSEIVTPVDELPSSTVQFSSPNLIFPTPTSSGWLTSSGIEFSSSVDFGPTSMYFPDASKPSLIGGLTEISSENSYDNESSSERIDPVSSEAPISHKHKPKPQLKEDSAESVTKLSTSTEEPIIYDSISNESTQEDSTKEREKVTILGNRNRTRKPYPVRNDIKKASISKFELPSKISSNIRPTRTLSRPEILYPTRHTSIRKVVRPVSTKSSTITPIEIIESSEPTVEEDFIRPTEVLRESELPSTTILEKTSVPSSMLSPIFDDMTTTVKPIHHSGNEIKISDEIIPTKTEFRTTIVTLTKTLSEAPKTVSSIGYLNLTHTLTVTHTKTSLLTLSEGAVTQTLVLTNTHTSTLVDVVTEIHTQVQPTTVIETVTKHIPVPKVEPTPVKEITTKTIIPLDDISMSQEENDNLIIRDSDTTENIQKIEVEGENDNDTFFVVMNKSQNGGHAPPVNTDIESGDYDGVTRNEQVNNNGVSQVLFGEILLAGAPYLETSNTANPTGIGYGKECQPDCKASRNERCQRIDGVMKCVCRPGFARMFPDRPCKPTYTYSVKLALNSQGGERLKFQNGLSNNSSNEYNQLAVATHEGINRMVMQSDLRDVYHGVHITGFQPVDMRNDQGELYQGVMNDFYVQLSDNAHESRLKEVIEKYLRNNNYSLGGTDVHASGELMDKLEVSDFDECVSSQFHDCSEHAQCFNLRGTYTCSCLEGFADLSVNTLYPGRICSAEPVGCGLCNYHGSCYSRDDQRVLCECFQWYAGSTCHINLKVVLISLVVAGAVLTIVLAVCAVVACRRPRPPQRSIVTCIQGMQGLHQGAIPKQRADRRALISERAESGDAASVQNASLPYMPTKRCSSSSKQCVMSSPPAHDAPPPPPQVTLAPHPAHAPAVMIPRARLHPHHTDSRDNITRKRSMELTNEDKLINYLESGAIIVNDEMRRKHSMESSYSAPKDRHNKQGALVSAGFKVSTTIRPEESIMKGDRDDVSSVHKADLEAELARFGTLRKSYSQEELSEWTDAERRIGELTLSEARSVGGTLPASTGRAASSTRLTHQEANTMAERDLGSTFLLPHVHLYKPDLTSDVSEFDSL